MRLGYNDNYNVLKIASCIGFAMNSETARRGWQNFARRPVSYLWNTWARSDVDKGHHSEEDCTFKTAFNDLTL